MESASNKLAIKYHDIFNYPLTLEELKKWKTGTKLKIKSSKVKIQIKDNYIFLKERENIITKRLENERYSKKKLEIAKKAASLISKIPTVLFVGITGSLAMMNAKKDSDIDLLIITKQNTLWTTRLIVYFVLRTMNYVLRRPRAEDERDALCLNMWLDETDLVWDKKDRNIYTAHEIAQVVPLFNKNKPYEKFLYLNKWILNYWPRAVEIRNLKFEIGNLNKKRNLIEKLSFFVQHRYMKNKITREVVTPTRAIFHPNDWGRVVKKKLSGAK